MKFTSAVAGVKLPGSVKGAVVEVRVAPALTVSILTKSNESFSVLKNGVHLLIGICAWALHSKASNPTRIQILLLDIKIL